MINKRLFSLIFSFLFLVFGIDFAFATEEWVKESPYDQVHITSLYYNSSNELIVGFTFVSTGTYNQGLILPQEQYGTSIQYSGNSSSISFGKWLCDGGEEYDFSGMMYLIRETDGQVLCKPKAIQRTWFNNQYYGDTISNATGLTKSNIDGALGTDFVETYFLIPTNSSIVGNQVYIWGSDNYPTNLNCAGIGTGIPFNTSGDFPFQYSSLVNGACGSSDGGSFEDTPTTNLCDSGLATEVQDDGETYLWTCQGTGGGSNDYCSANVTIGSYTPMLSELIFPLSNLTGITLGSTTEISSSSLSLTGNVYYAGYDEDLNIDQIQFVLQNINDYSEIKSNTFSFEEYLTSNENVESFSVSFTGISENKKYLVYYNVHTTTGQTLKMLPSDATYVRYGVYTPVSIPVDFDSNNYTAPECSIDNMGACFKSIILWAFTPSEDTLQKWKNTSETISSKVPFGYFYLIANKFKSIQLDTLSPNTNLAVDFVINNQTMRFLDIRQLIEDIGQENYDFYMNLCRAVIWFMFLEYLFNRLTGLGNSESVIQGFKPN